MQESEMMGHVAEQLKNFSPNESLNIIITEMLNWNPAERPTLKQVKSKLLEIA